MMIGALIFRNVPRKKAMEMILLGQRLTAAQALEMGMVTRVVPDADFDAEVAGTRDAREGITAFLEKRTPQFKGE